MLKSTDTEDAVCMVWNTMLGWLFPAAQGYSVGPEVRLPKIKGDTVGRADLVVQEFAWRDRDHHRLRCNFAILECKRPSRLREKDIWENSEEQIQEYLTGAKVNTPSQFRSIKRWGAIAIGTSIQFYSHMGGETEPVELLKDGLGRSTFSLIKDYQHVQNTILDIKEHQHSMMTVQRRAQKGELIVRELSSSPSTMDYDTDEYQASPVRGRSPGLATQSPSTVGGTMSYGLRSQGPSDPHVNYYRMAPQPQFEQLPYRSRNFSSSPLAYSMHNYEDEYEQRHRRR